MKIFVITVCLLIAFVSIVRAQVGDDDTIHVATVTEVINDGGYSFIQCDENGMSKWLLLPEINITAGDWIEFPNGTQKANFVVKSINKRFTLIYVVPGLRKVAKGESVMHEHSMYRAEDKNGTLVFTDNPERLPAKKNRK